MLTGQESIVELLQKSKRVASILGDFGITPESAEHLRFQNLAHAAIILKQPLKKILTAVAEVTGEEIREPSVKGLSVGVKRGLKKGFPEGVKRSILIHSGKGGVGKTFVTVNLAAALAKRGFRVGVLDADIDCPNVMKVLGLEGQLVANADKKIVPLEAHAVKVVSMAPMFGEENVTMWRGPIISRAFEQLLYDTAWGELDFLLVDLPPGTSDIPISALNMLGDGEMLVVTTPQELALMDARKSLELAKKMNVKVLGIVENMTGEVFGMGSAKKLGVPVVASVELRKVYAEGLAILLDESLANALVKSVL